MRLFQVSRRETLEFWMGLHGTGIGQEWIDLEHILKVELIGFADGLECRWIKGRED